MTRFLPTNDFRAIRQVLEEDDFALAEGPELPPSDLIENDTWSGIMTLPDDVAIRTSNHHGSVLKLMYELWSVWWVTIGETEDLLHVPMLDAGDDFNAAIFNLLHGFYRQACDSLRSALELISIGAWYQLTGRDTEFQQWRTGQLVRDIGLNLACDGIRSVASTLHLETHLQTVLQDDLFRRGNRRTGEPGGWVRRLFGDLSHYVHSRPGYTNGDMWSSNGPIYDRRAAITTSSYYLQTMAGCYFMIKLARPPLELPQAALQLFTAQPMRTLQIAQETYRYLFQM
jgi:hypothetical protein